MHQQTRADSRPALGRANGVLDIKSAPVNGNSRALHLISKPHEGAGVAAGAANSTEPGPSPSEFAFDAAEDVLGEVDARRAPLAYQHTLLPEGSIVSAFYNSFALRNVGGRFKLTAEFTIVEADAGDEFRGLPLFYGRNVPEPGWLTPQHYIALDWVAVMPEGVRPPCLPKFHANPRSSDKAGRKRLQRVGKALLEELFLGVDGSVVLVTATTVQVKQFMDTKSREWITRPDRLWYSRIGRITGREAGCPRGAARARRRGRA